MKKIIFSVLVSFVSCVGQSGTMTWGPLAPVDGLGDTHMIDTVTVAELYKDSGDGIFTWGGEGSVLQVSPLLDIGGNSFIFGDSYNYGVAQGVQNFWVVYHDTTGTGYYSVPAGGVHSVANDAIGNALDSYNVGSQTTWTSIVPVPEPSTMGLLLVGAGLVAFRRMRRS